ncbi:hypothetical protein, conserved [Eimeria brunetti]|uniref:Uncharacterized protein n=1 Tax=Eimeria brunetti TaxID=51314 RepID=U6L7T7_9EIME|nr:hypothetical protein, conserved [Eimeria brunetti]
MDCFLFSPKRGAGEIPRPSSPAPCPGTNPEALRASQLLKRLNDCAALDKRFFRACFHALYTEHLRRGVEGKGTTGTSGAKGARGRACQETPEEVLKGMLQYLDDYDQRERATVDGERILNRQYKQLQAELSHIASGSAKVGSLRPENSTFNIPPVQGLSRLALLEFVISAKEREQVRQMYDMRHHNYEAFGMYLPKLPGPLRDGAIVERVNGQLRYTSEGTAAITGRPY